MKVKNIMTSHVQTGSVDASLTKVATEMWEAGCGIIPLIDAEAKVVGVITDRDIAMALVNSSRRPANIAAREVMTRHVHACGPDDDVHTALATMAEHRLRRLPVVSESGQLRGMLSIDDIVLRALSPGAPTSNEIISALRTIVEFRTRRPEPAIVG